MRSIRVSRLVGAALAGGALAACNLVLGLDGYAGGAGGGSGGTGARDGGVHGDAATDGDGAGESTAGQPIWSKGFAGATVTSMAAAGDGSVYLTGRASEPGGFGCKVVSAAGEAPDASVGSGCGFLVQLGETGACEWGFFFGDGGDSAQGTGVAVDPVTGKVALTGSFTNSLAINNWPTLSTLFSTDSFVLVLDASSDHEIVWLEAIGDDVLAGQSGYQNTTGVAILNGTVAVSGTYTGSLGAERAGSISSFVGVTTTSDAEDAFAIWFDEGSGAYTSAFRVLSGDGSSQIGTGVALDLSKNVAMTGTTKGSTIFNSGSGLPAFDGGSIFLASHSQVSATQNVATILSADQAQHGRSVAFDSSGALLVGGDFAGTVAVADGGPSYTTSGTSAVVALYDGTGMPLGSLQLGAGVTLTGAVPFPVLGTTGTTVDAGASVVLAGSFSGAASLGDGGTVLQSNGAGTNVYVAKVDSALSTLLWARSFGDDKGPQTTSAVAVDPVAGSIYIAGQYLGTLDFGDAGTLVNHGTPQLFVAKLMP
jgi:hypothetical protein